MVKIKQYDPRPSRANPEARAARKNIENPHFSMSEVAMKGGALALLTAVALFPWEKELEKHERTHHPEQYENEKKKIDKKGRRGSGRDGRRGRRISEDDSNEDRREGRRRRQSEGGEREREYRRFLDRDREYRSLPVEVAPEIVDDGERYTGSEDGEYGRRYIQASRKEKEYRHRREEGDYGRRGSVSVDYDYRRGGSEG